LPKTQTVGVRDKIGPIWELLKANPLTGAVGFIFFVALIFLLAGSLQQRWQDSQTDRAVERLEGKADTEQRKAGQELTQAEKAAGVREGEEARRQFEIKPAIERASRNRAAARAATQKAGKDYETSKTADLVNPELDALRERNCSDYSILYPTDYGRRCAQ